MPDVDQVSDPAGAGLTEAQTRVLDAIKTHIREHAWPPTVREVQAALGFGSSSTAAHHIHTLIRKGWLTRGEGPRTLRVTTPDKGEG